MGVRILGAAGAGLFAWAAALQHNDPDPLRWAALYLAAAALCAVAPYRALSPRLPGLLAAVAALWALALAPRVLAGGGPDAAELGRELAGLAAVAGVAVGWLLHGRRRAGGAAG